MKKIRFVSAILLASCAALFSSCISMFIPREADSNPDRKVHYFSDVSLPQWDDASWENWMASDFNFTRPETISLVEKVFSQKDALFAKISRNSNSIFDFSYNDENFGLCLSGLQVRIVDGKIYYPGIDFSGVDCSSYIERLEAMHEREIALNEFNKWAGNSFGKYEENFSPQGKLLVSCDIRFDFIEDEAGPFTPNGSKQKGYWKPVVINFKMEGKNGRNANYPEENELEKYRKDTAMVRQKTAQGEKLIKDFYQRRAGIESSLKAQGFTVHSFDEANMNAELFKQNALLPDHAYLIEGEMNGSRIEVSDWWNGDVSKLVSYKTPALKNKAAQKGTWNQYFYVTGTNFGMEVVEVLGKYPSCLNPLHFDWDY